ncbi:transmembrane protease serine 9 [Megachile rotundata]|uniref:transmembrane protease serine 9 n=1 Tax=Megachile rotundata TaxID=143995 RepID=UPI003FD52BA3
MKVLCVSLLLCLVASAFGDLDSRIVGGREAPSGKFPYQVSLRQNGRHFCGGSIISSRYILTAAHCVQGLSNLKAITVVAGSTQLNSGGVSYGVEKAVYHNGFSQRTLVNDVAVIRVDRNIAFNNLIKPISLASGSNSYDGASCVLSGWGTLKAGGNVPNNLQYINLNVLSVAQCKQTHSNVGNSHICTFTKYGEGACNGDSGGPLVVNNVQVGVVSFGIPCGVGKPDVYTRVSSFIPWIKQQQTYLADTEFSLLPEDSVLVATTNQKYSDHKSEVLISTQLGDLESRIVGGRDASSGMFPYQVSLRQNGRHFCGGSIISSRYILTAAHCVEGMNNLKAMSVVVGTNQLNSGGVSYGVEKAVYHKDYDEYYLVNDVAVIRVDRNIAFNNLVKPISLASGSNSYDGSACILSGWGRVQAGGNIPNNLQYINLNVLSVAQCKKTHSNVRSSHICTFTKYGEGACNGDSGGPLVVNGVQVGVVSFGIPCGVGKPDVYTRVSSFVSWIKQQQTYLADTEFSLLPEDSVLVA